MDGQSLFCILNILIYLSFALVGLLFFFPPMNHRSCLFDQFFLIVHGVTAAFLFFLTFSFILTTRSETQPHPKAKPLLTFATATCCLLTMTLICGGVLLFGLSNCEEPPIRVVSLALWVFTIIDFFLSLCASLICRQNSCAEAGYATLNHDDFSGDWATWKTERQDHGAHYQMGENGEIAMGGISDFGGKGEGGRGKEEGRRKKEEGGRKKKEKRKKKERKKKKEKRKKKKEERRKKKEAFET